MEEEHRPHEFKNNNARRTVERTRDRANGRTRKGQWKRLGKGLGKWAGERTRGRTRSRTRERTGERTMGADYGGTKFGKSHQVPFLQPTACLFCLPYEKNGNARRKLDTSPDCGVELGFSTFLI